MVHINLHANKSYIVDADPRPRISKSSKIRCFILKIDVNLDTRDSFNCDLMTVLDSRLLLCTTLQTLAVPAVSINTLRFTYLLNYLPGYLLIFCNSANEIFMHAPGFTLILAVPPSKKLRCPFPDHHVFPYKFSPKMCVRRHHHEQ